ncbi:unnamed protein product [Mytilus edulis]|uniref:Uncharacterized protein n=1 Tax=Mytilus edulis TaxID=6550 RepID=A0A8S3T835_MYTED|nr:unnamed protein product [Mytilus edulis]
MEKHNGTFAHSNIKISSKTTDIYADKDVSVIDLDAFICNSCDKSEFKTNSQTDDILKMKSAYEIMLDVDISIPNNTNQFGDASNGFKESKNSSLRIISIQRRFIWYGLQPSILVIFALLLYVRYEDMFFSSNAWSEISEHGKIEFSWNWLCLGNVINSAFNPALHSCFIMFDTLQLAKRRLRQYLRSVIF